MKTITNWIGSHKPLALIIAAVIVVPWCGSGVVVGVAAVYR